MLLAVALPIAVTGRAGAACGSIPATATAFLTGNRYLDDAVSILISPAGARCSSLSAVCLSSTSTARKTGDKHSEYERGPPVAALSQHPNPTDLSSTT